MAPKDENPAESLPIRVASKGKPRRPGEWLRTLNGTWIDANELAEFHDSLRSYAKKIRAGSRNAAIAMAGLVRSPPADVPLPPEALSVLADLLEGNIRFKDKPGPKSRLDFFSRNEVLKLLQFVQSALKATDQRGGTDRKAAIEKLAELLEGKSIFDLTANEIDQIVHRRRPRKPRQ